MESLQVQLERQQRWLKVFESEGESSFNLRDVKHEIELLTYAISLQAEVARLKSLNESLCERIAAQSELLTKKTAKSTTVVGKPMGENWIK